MQQYGGRCDINARRALDAPAKALETLAKALKKGLALWGDTANVPVPGFRRDKV